VRRQPSLTSSYDLIKRRLLRTGYFADSIPLHLLTATLGGTISITICTPVDVIKSRVQASTSQTVSPRPEGPLGSHHSL
jgi:dicarboxylate transporter 10